MELERLLTLWQQYHGELTEDLKERFRANEKAAALCHYPDEIVDQVVGVYPKLVDSLRAAREELGIRGESDDGSSTWNPREPRLSGGSAGGPIVGLEDLADPSAIPAELRRIDEEYRRDTEDEDRLPDVDGFSFDPTPLEPRSNEEEDERRLNEYSEETGTYLCHTCQQRFPLAAFEYTYRGTGKVATNCASCRQRFRRRRQ